MPLMATLALSRAGGKIDDQGGGAGRSAHACDRLRLVTVVIPGIIFFLVPLVLWTGPFGTRMNTGGDNSLLYFQYPVQWLFHSPVHALSFGASGYNPQSQYAVFTSMLAILKWLHLNPEGVLLGLNLGFGYMGTAILTVRLLAKRGLAAHLGGAIAGLIVVCAPELAANQWTSILPELFWVGLLPITLLLYLHHQESGRLTSAAVAGILWVVFAPAITDAPGFIPVFITGIVMAAIFAVTGVYQFNKRRALVFSGIVAGLSLFWAIPFLLAGPFFKIRGLTLTSTSTFKASSGNLATTLVRQTSVGDTLGLRGSYQMATLNAWSQIVPMRWSQDLAPIGLFPLLLFAGSIAGSPPRREEWKGRLRLDVALFLLALVMFYLLTLRGLPDGASIYSFLIRHVPAWDILRNFYVVWAIPFALTVALTVGVWSTRLFQVIDIRAAISVTAIFAMGFVVYGAPFLGGTYFRLEGNTLGGSRVTSGFPPRYLAVLDFIKRLPPGSVMTVPLRSTSWSYVPTYQGSKFVGAYLGISPIFYLTGRSDFDGVDGFSTPGTDALSTALTNDVQNVQLPEIARTAGAVGVRYLLVDSSEFRNPIEMKPYVVPAAQSVSEWRAFVTNYAPQVIFSDGDYSVHLLSAAFRSPLATVVAKGDPIASTSYPLLVAAGLPGHSPGESTACSSPPIGVTSWKAESATVDLRAPQAGCILHVSVAPAPGWSATFRSSNGASVTTPALSYNQSGVNFRIPRTTGRHASLVVQLIYKPAFILAVSASLSSALLAVVAAAVIADLSRRRSRSRGSAGDEISGNVGTMADQ